MSSTRWTVAGEVPSSSRRLARRTSSSPHLSTISRPERLSSSSDVSHPQVQPPWIKQSMNVKPYYCTWRKPLPTWGHKRIVSSWYKPNLLPVYRPPLCHSTRQKHLMDDASNFSTHAGFIMSSPETCNQSGICNNLIALVIGLCDRASLKNAPAVCTS